MENNEAKQEVKNINIQSLKDLAIYLSGVKALIIKKENYPHSITYINQDRRIYTITGNHKFWYTTKVGDSVLVTFKNWDNPEFLNVAALKKSTLNDKKILYPYLIKYK